MTFAEFEKIPEGHIFRVVTTKFHHINHSDGVWPELTFVCKKGMGYDDWAIYCEHSDKTAEWIAENGDKVKSEKEILSIFPCDNNILSKYRY